MPYAALSTSTTHPRHSPSHAPLSLLPSLPSALCALPLAALPLGPLADACVLSHRIRLCLVPTYPASGLSSSTTVPSLSTSTQYYHTQPQYQHQHHHTPPQYYSTQYHQCSPQHAVAPECGFGLSFRGGTQYLSRCADTLSILLRLPHSRQHTPHSRQHTRLPRTHAA
eukprot:1595737-Rhodomonas_salina.1